MTQTQAFFISPYGELIPAGHHHIDTVIENPEKFGWTKERIENEYKKHKESIGHEGYAREKIITDIVKKGWMRVRYMPNFGSFKIQLFKFDKDAKERIYDFSNIVKSKKPKIDVGYKIGEFTAISVIDLNANEIFYSEIADLTSKLWGNDDIEESKKELPIIMIENYEPIRNSFKQKWIK